MAFAGVAAVAVAATLCLSGCANLGYYWQSATGHLKVMSAAKPIDDWLADAQTPERLKARAGPQPAHPRLRRDRTQAAGQPQLPPLCGPAAQRRGLERGGRARRIRSRSRPGASRSRAASATAATSTRPRPGPRLRELAAQGLEASVYPVPAYSTLGWMNWAGGDPLLNTFIDYPEGELARLIFHELAHQVLYAKNDTMFNESFATAVERLGGARWLADAGLAMPRARSTRSSTAGAASSAR